jgi:dTDP-4-dehydrorhamnose reductase
VDKCEQEPLQAYKTNAIGAKNVAIAAQRFDSLMVYISTDYVFDGKKGDFYTEFDSVNPINIYGETKLQGENFVRQILNRHLIIRTSWLFGSYRNNYISYWSNGIIKKEKIVVVDDQYGCPTYVKDLAECIKILVLKNKLGLYHITNSGGCSRLDVVKEIFFILGQEFDLKKVELVSPQKVFKKALRPRDTRLKNFVWEIEELPKIHSWQEAVKEFLKETKF